MSDRARTIFLGTGQFAVPIVDALSRDSHAELIAVVTAPRRESPSGKPIEPPVALWAVEHGIPTFRPARLRATSAVEHIREHGPDLLVLADYGQIVPAELLDIPRHGALNLHPSLLPAHRGATPIPAAILAGDEVTGVTLMQMDSGLDTGPVISKELTPIGATETAPELEARLAVMAAGLLTRDLEAWLAGNITPHPQPADGASLSRPLRREDGRLGFSKTARLLERQVRAYQPWPGSFLEVGSLRIVVWRAHTENAGAPNGRVGSLYRTAEGGLALQVADGGLVLDEVQPSGGKRMSGAELLRGRPGIVNS